MHIPLPKMMRHYREQEFERGMTPGAARFALKLWAFLAARPRLYQALTGIEMRVLGALGRKRGRFGWLPFAGGWTRHRDFPAPQGKTFQQRWAERGGAR